MRGKGTMYKRSKVEEGRNSKGEGMGWRDAGERVDKGRVSEGRGEKGREGR